MTLLGAAVAGGGSETVLVVVNGESQLSWLVAREYCALREIPEEHVLSLHGVPGNDVIAVDEFRERIWGPIRAYLEGQGLEDEIDCIAYSADFPYGVDFTADVGDSRPGRQVGRLASLTGLTYLGRRVERSDTSYLDLQGVNRYYRGRQTRAATPAESNTYRKAMAALRAKNHEVAAEALERLLSTYAGDSSVWYNYACCLSLLGKTDAALSALGSSVDHGWRDEAHTKHDADLAPLRGKKQFEMLLSRMATPAALDLLPTRAFDSAVAWDQAGEPDPAAADDALDRYFLSTMLAYTGQRGNSLPEIQSYLASAAGSDFTHPGGTIYFCKNSDVRSSTREHMFAPVGTALGKLGRRVSILEKGQGRQDGKIPQGLADVAGAVIGIARFDWAKSGSTILPGAICEHLTSFGAAFRNAGQTKLTELLRHGAAGASGTVTEPLALFAKFPSPAIHLHYAQGTSLVEAFYQSVSGPYQLLIVGDPLARPHAQPARVEWRLPAGNNTWTGSVRVAAEVEPAAGHAIDHVELWVDGQCLQTADADAELTLDSTTLDDGIHSMLLVAVEASAIATRSAAPATVRIRNRGPGRQSQVVGDVTLGETVRLEGSAQGADAIEILRGHEVLANATPDDDGAWSCEFPSEGIGLGVCALFARALYASGPADRGEPISLRVRAPTPHASRTGDDPLTLTGATLVALDSTGVAHPVTLADLDPARARKLALPAGIEMETVALTGELLAMHDGFHQLMIETSGTVSLTVGDRVVHEVEQNGVRRLPLFLAQGWHAIDLRVRPRGRPHLRLELAGFEVTAPLTDQRMRTPLDGLSAAPTHVVRVDKGASLAVLTDGKRVGEATPLPAGGLLLGWKKRCKNLQAVVCHVPATDQGAWPSVWRVETPRGQGGKSVRDLRVSYGPARSAGKGEPAIPLWVRFEFSPISVKVLRILCERDGKPVGTVRLSEVEALVGQSRGPANSTR